MREDDTGIRYYMPVVRRLVILAAVIAAVPVVMWTITGFVRTYMGPVKAPTIQTTMAAPVAAAPDQTATIPAESPPPPASVDPAAPTNAAANAPSGSQNGTGPSMTITSSVGPANKGPVAGPDAAPPAPASAAGTGGKMAMSNPATTTPPPANAATNGIWPAPMAPPMVPMASVAPIADALRASEPIAGPVPLPRKRPHSFAVAQASIPVPRPRPAPTAAAAPAPSTAYTVTPAAAEAPAGSPFDWLRHLFQPSPPAAASGPQEDFSGAH
ncbi:MAG: hypothetical protein WB760_33500 [Xanthobacteraceae bacterium]